MNRDVAREQARAVNSVTALAIRHPGGMYFCGFGGKPGQPKVKWSGMLAEAKLFNATAISQAEKYIGRINGKDSLYIGMKIVKVIAAEDACNDIHGAGQK